MSIEVEEYKKLLLLEMDKKRTGLMTEPNSRYRIVALEMLDRVERMVKEV